MTPPQPNTIDPRAELEAIFAHEQLATPEHTEHMAKYFAPKKQVFTPHIASGVTELELIEQAKSHAPAPEKSNFEHLEQIALISMYINHLRDTALQGARR